jgi:hypothetical protein
MRISVTNWSTDEADIDASVRAILKISAHVRPVASDQVRPDASAPA